MKLRDDPSPIQTVRKCFATLRYSDQIVTRQHQRMNDTFDSLLGAPCKSVKRDAQKLVMCKNRCHLPT